MQSIFFFCGRRWSAILGIIIAQAGKRLRSNNCHFVKYYCLNINLFHTYVQYASDVKIRHQMAPSEAIAEVDWPMYALSKQK